MNAEIPHPTCHAALSDLADRSLLRSLAYLDGRWCAAGDAADFAVTDPASGALVARVAGLGRTETEAAIAASACGEVPGRGEKGKVLALVDGEAITEEMQATGIELVEPALQFQFLPSPEELEQCRELGRKIAARVKSSCNQ